MNDLIRPALYEAYHAIVPVAEVPPEAERVLVDVVGPICESGDTFARARALPPVKAGDLLAFRTAGAYGASMASIYNARDVPAEVLVNGADFAVVADRSGIADWLRRQHLAPWMEPPAVAPLQATPRGSR
jgi:diaminopimelate decarboxylase